MLVSFGEDWDGDGYDDDTGDWVGGDSPGSYYDDPWSMDSDGDGYSDGEESSYGTDPYSSSSYPGSGDYSSDPDYSDPMLTDSDGDSLLDGDEQTWGTDPMDQDTDDDLLSDYEEVNGVEIHFEYEVSTFDETSGESHSQTYSYSERVYPDPTRADTDGDLIPDGVEYSMGFHPTDSGDGQRDDDSDGLSNGEEYQAGTGMWSFDSDHDGWSDGDEVLVMGTNPRDASDPPPPENIPPSAGPDDPYAMDSDGDGVSDGEEIDQGTDPNDASSYPGSGGSSATDSPGDTPGGGTGESDESAAEPPPPSDDGPVLAGRTVEFFGGGVDGVGELPYDPEWEEAMRDPEYDWASWEAANPDYMSVVDGGPRPRAPDLSEGVVPYQANRTWNGEKIEIYDAWHVFTNHESLGGPHPVGAPGGSYLGSRWNAENREGETMAVDSASISSETYPQGTHAEVWLRRPMAEGPAISRTFLVVATRTGHFEEDGTPDYSAPPTEKRCVGSITLTIPEGGKVSTASNSNLPSDFPANWINVSGGSVLLTPIPESPWQTTDGSGYEGGVDAEVSLLPVDLDIDSDNNNGFDLPDRSGEEEAVEDVENDDEKPGKVILLNNGDADKDGVPDFADGFDWEPALDMTDTCTGSRFIPLIVTLGGHNEHAKLRFTYPSSDPSEIQTTIEDPFKLPENGNLRIWTKDGEDFRRKESVHEGGDYIASGTEYPWQIFDFDSSNNLILYVEAVKTSAATADLTVNFECDLAGNGDWIQLDQVRLTATDIKFLAQNLGEPEWFETEWIVGSVLTTGGSEDDETSISIGSWQKYKLQIEDPRENLSEISVGNSILNLSRNGAFLETNAWYFTTPGSDRNMSDATGVDPAGAIEFFAQYNPFEWRPWAWFKSKEPVFELSRIVHEVTQEMEEAQWDHVTEGYDPNHNGAFGIEVEKRVSSRLPSGWMSNIWVRKSNHEILAIGEMPAGIPSSEIGEVDIVKLKPGQSLSVGETGWASKIDDAFEMKTSIGGRIRANQKALYGAIFGVNYKVVHARRFYNFATRQWDDSLPVVRRIRIFKYFGIAFSAFAIIETVTDEDRFTAMEETMAEVKLVSDPIQKTIGAASVASQLGDYLSGFDPSGVTDFMTIALMYKVLGEASEW